MAKKFNIKDLKRGGKASLARNRQGGGGILPSLLGESGLLGY